MTYKLCQNANFKNGGTTIQMGIMHVLLNIWPISVLSMVHGTVGYFEAMLIYILKKINEMQVAG